jgi:hypothetical protein
MEEDSGVHDGEAEKVTEVEEATWTVRGPGNLVTGSCDTVGALSALHHPPIQI